MFIHSAALCPNSTPLTQHHQSPPICMAMISWLAKVHLDMLPTGAGGCPSTISHAESASQHGLLFKDLLHNLAIWTETHTADSDKLAN